MSIKLKNVRLSFPNLYETEFYAGDDTKKYSATFILDPEKHRKEIKQIKTEIEKLKKDLKKKLSESSVCLKQIEDGDDSVHYTIKCKTIKRPLTIGRDKALVLEQDNVFYAGCYVNAIVNPWAQDNKWGKRINCSLEGVQFSADGQPFGKPSAKVDDFDELPDEELPDDDDDFEDDIPF